MVNSHLKDRISRAGVTQVKLAVALGIEPSLFSRMVRGLRPMPEGFEERVHAALDRLEAAERAAAEAAEAARARVLAEGES